MVRAKNKTLVLVKKLCPGGAKGLEGMVRLLVFLGLAGLRVWSQRIEEEKQNAHGSSVCAYQYPMCACFTVG